jgi:DNA replication protein DnaC
MVEALPARVAQAEAAPLAHLEFLELLVEDELARRADRLFARRLKQAGIVTLKTLADFDWAFNPKLPKPKLVELAPARFVQTHAGSCSSARLLLRHTATPRYPSENIGGWSSVA